MKAVDAYRRAAIELWGMTPAEAAVGIVEPDEDPGEWAPESLVIIYMEGQTPMEYWGDGMEQGFKLQALAGVGYVEFINAAVAAVYE